MSEEAVKRRIADAKKSAKRKCRDLGYDIINSDNEIFCFTACIAGIYERKIRIVVDEVTKGDKELIEKIRILPNQTKEIWCRPYNSKRWKTLRFDHSNNLCQ